MTKCPGATPLAVGGRELAVMLERLLRTLVHPRLVMASLAVLQLHTAVVTTWYPLATLRIVPLWIAIAASAGICGLAAVIRPSRVLVAASGAMIVFASAVRGLALLDRVLWPTPGVSDQFRASAAIATAQWFVVGYVTFVVWRRLVVPWSALYAAERRKVTRD